MLNEKTLELLSERLTERIHNVNLKILKTVGEQLKYIGTLNPTTAHQLVNVLKYGGDIDKIVRELAKVTELNIQEIFEIFEEVAKQNYHFAKQFYEYRNKPYIPYKENIALRTEVLAMAKITAESYMNISRSTAMRINGKDTPLSIAYQEAIDEGLIAISQGKDTYTQQIRKTVRELGRNGIRYVDYDSGYSRRLDSTVRMNIMDGMRDLHNRTQEIIAEQVEADGIEISVHDNPAPDHYFQGIQMDNKNYELMQSNKDFKDLKGRHYKAIERAISTMNCYHYIFSIVIGISEPNYSEEQLQEILDKNDKGFKYKGKHYTMYEGTQLQRRIELEVRIAKEAGTIAKASGDDEEFYKQSERIKHLMKEYKELNEVSGLRPKIERLKI